MMMTSTGLPVFIGRQQIYDCELNIVAYELLFRSKMENEATFLDAEAATSQLLINAILEIGLENIVFGRPAFVNFTQNFILDECGLPFEPDQLVIEVLESVEPNDEVVCALARLKDRGYTIALDDYVESDKRRSLLEVTDIVKVDISKYGHRELIDDVKRLKKLPLKMLTEKVETIDEFNHCKDLGFDYFQGYFLSYPQILKGTTIGNDQLSILRLLAKLQDPTVSFDAIVDLIKQDLSLSVKLLRCVNSVIQGVRRPIESVRQAVIRVGLHKIRQLATLISIGGITGRPHPLLETALVRARMCEILGTLSFPARSEMCFTLGLFSSLDALLGRSLVEILSELPLAAEIREALLSHEGPLGRLLNTVLAFERGDWDEITQSGADEIAVQTAYLNAAAWANVGFKIARIAASAGPA